MSSRVQSETSRESQVALDALKRAVAHALEKKRRLGQYAVVWRNGEPARIEGDAIDLDEREESGM